MKKMGFVILYAFAALLIYIGILFAIDKVRAIEVKRIEVFKYSRESPYGEDNKNERIITDPKNQA